MDRSAWWKLSMIISSPGYSWIFSCVLLLVGLQGVLTSLQASYKRGSPKAGTLNSFSASSKVRQFCYIGF